MVTFQIRGGSLATRTGGAPEAPLQEHAAALISTGIGVVEACADSQARPVRGAAAASLGGFHEGE
jgi:hypothetical protein